MLETVLRDVIERIKKYRSIYERNEMAVRYQIVNPILKSLGWNPENPEEVMPNLSTEEGTPDYCLLKNGKEILFIETKKLSADIERKEIVSQLAKYCFGEGTKYGLLTNGGVWILFKAFQEGTKMGERILWKTDIERDDTMATLRKLKTISKENIENIENLIRKLQILDEIWNSLVDDPEELIRGLIPVFKGLLGEGYPDYEFEPSEIEDFLKEKITELIVPTEETEIIPSGTSTWGGTRPRKMIIGNNVYNIRNSYEILTQTAEWLIKNGKLRKIDCPIPAGPKRYLVNTEPKHRYGNNFRAPKRLSNGLYIEVHYSTAGIISYARRLLERFGYRGDILKLQ
ncbi:hypothetical protein CW700_02950 [Candidatus Bathyarchaeota archaeon]|nr:MAG: hypothetical protein CW700_02950 [Candidatus Bathyarchaeota archaeon]